MSTFDPALLTVTLRPPITAEEPINGRRYTLTHSDETAELFLTIGPCFAYDEISELRDEVLGEWTQINGRYIFSVYLYVYGYDIKGSPEIRNTIFRRELPLALQAIRYGDSALFEEYPELDQSEIVGCFQSSILYYNSVESLGTFDSYK